MPDLFEEPLKEFWTPGRKRECWTKEEFMLGFSRKTLSYFFKNTEINLCGFCLWKLFWAFYFILLYSSACTANDEKHTGNISVSTANYLLVLIFAAYHQWYHSWITWLTRYFEFGVHRVQVSIKTPFITSTILQKKSFRSYRVDRRYFWETVHWFIQKCHRELLQLFSNG